MRTKNLKLEANFRAFVFYGGG